MDYGDLYRLEFANHETTKRVLAKVQTERDAEVSRSIEMSARLSDLQCILADSPTEPLMDAACRVIAERDELRKRVSKLDTITADEVHRLVRDMVEAAVHGGLVYGDRHAGWECNDAALDGLADTIAEELAGKVRP